MFATLIRSLAANEASLAARRVGRAAIAYALVGVLLAIGIGFLIGAGYIWVAERHTPLIAALSFGAGFLVLAAIVYMIHRFLYAARERRRVEEARANEIRAMAAATALGVVPTLMKSRAGILTLLLPAISIVVMAIYRENGGRDKQS